MICMYKTRINYSLNNLMRNITALYYNANSEMYSLTLGLTRDLLGADVSIQHYNWLISIYRLVYIQRLIITTNIYIYIYV